jgi:glycosyltransferase involved in cell wall biosynthesis
VPAASVVICTHDRAALLRRAVAGALGEAAAHDAEVLVVDNASRDDTPAILEALVREHGGRLRAVHEPELGLSAARNRGLAAARSPIVVYLDDEATPRPGWLAALLAPYREPAVACVGGRIVLRFEGTPPPWLVPPLDAALSAYDQGDRPRRLRYRPGDVYPFGANISFRVKDAVAAGGFSTAVGPLGRRQLVHDETDLCFRLDVAGREIHYAPAAVVDHLVVAERLSPAWILRRHYLGGVSGATFEIKNRGLWRALGKLRWYYRPRVTWERYVPREPVDAASLVRACARREALGYAAGLVRGTLRLRELRREGPPHPIAPFPALHPDGAARP